MIARTLALLHRALRVDARMLRTHLFRAALVGIVIFALSDAQNSWAGAPGLEFFSWLQFYNFWFITFAGATFFPTCVTEEKEELTLGLLKLAGVNPLSLLLGKWTPRLLGAVLLLSVQFPFMLLAITLGGVLMHQAVASYCALAAHLLLVGAIGLFASVVCRKSTGACLLAGTLLAGLILGPYIAIGVAEVLANAGILSDSTAALIAAACGWVLNTSAMLRIDAIMATGFNESPLSPQVIANLVVSVALFAASWALFGPCTRNELASVAAGGGWWSRLIRVGRGRPWSMAIPWKEFSLTCGGAPVIVLKGVAYAALIAAITTYSALAMYGYSNPDLSEMLAAIMLTTMLVVLFVEAAVIAARIYRSEIKDQTWPGLILLPRTLPETAYAKLAGSLLTLAPATALLLTGFIIEPEYLEEFLEHVIFDEAILGFGYFMCQIVLFLHLTTLLSILWTWAAWPVSIFFAGFIVIMGNALVGSCCTLSGPVDDEAIFFVGSVCSSVLIVIVHLWIGQQLSRLAAA